jgi:hypothetical protein
VEDTLSIVSSFGSSTPVTILVACIRPKTIMLGYCRLIPLKSERT